MCFCFLVTKEETPYEQLPHYWILQVALVLQWF